MSLPTIERVSDREKRFESAEAEFAAVENKIALLRQWISVHANALRPFGWNAMVSSQAQIMFFSFHEENKDPKAIARAFGADGWKRQKDSYKCGSLDWVKELDGVTLKICEAEQVDFNPRENVRL